MRGRTALVTGGASGIGLATARHLAAGGASVIVADVVDAASAAATCDPPADPLAVDLRDLDAFLEALRSRRPDVLVNCAGLGPDHPHAIDVATVNLGAPTAACRTAPEWMAPGGIVVTVASIVGHLVDDRYDDLLDLAPDTRALEGLGRLPSREVYGYSKRGVLRMTEASAVPLGRAALRALSVSPGLVDTPMSDRSSDLPLIRSLAADAPLPGAIPAGDVAALIAGLVALRPQHMTGTDVLVDRGWLAWHRGRDRDGGRRRAPSADDPNPRPQTHPSTPPGPPPRRPE